MKHIVEDLEYHMDTDVILYHSMHHIHTGIRTVFILKNEATQPMEHHAQQYKISSLVSSSQTTSSYAMVVLH
jgi:hypothetical protein